METCVVYKSHSGMTERIAKYIGRQLDCDVKPLKSVNTLILMNYELVIFGAPMEFGNIKCMHDIIVKKEEINSKLIVFATGAKPASLVDMESLSQQIPEKYRKHFAYFQTGISYEKAGMLRIGKLKKYCESEKALPAINKEHQAFQAKLDHSFECINKEAVDQFIADIQAIPDPMNIF